MRKKAREFTLGLAAALILLMALLIIWGLRKGRDAEETLQISYLFEELAETTDGWTGKCNMGIRNLGEVTVNGWEAVLDCGGCDAEISGVYNCSISVDGHVMVLKSVTESAKVGPEEQSPIFGFQFSVPAGTKFAFRSVEVRALEEYGEIIQPLTVAEEETESETVQVESPEESELESETMAQESGEPTEVPQKSDESENDDFGNDGEKAIVPDSNQPTEASEVKAGGAQNAINESVPINAPESVPVNVPEDVPEAAPMENAGALESAYEPGDSVFPAMEERMLVDDPISNSILPEENGTRPLE